MNTSIDINEADQVLNVVARVAASRRGMSVAVAKNLLMLGTEPTRDNAVLYARQSLGTKREEIA